MVIIHESSGSSGTAQNSRWCYHPTIGPHEVQVKHSMCRRNQRQRLGPGESWLGLACKASRMYSANQRSVWKAVQRHYSFHTPWNSELSLFWPVWVASVPRACSQMRALAGGASLRLAAISPFSGEAQSPPFVGNKSDRQEQNHRRRTQVDGFLSHARALFNHIRNKSAERMGGRQQCRALVARSTAPRAR